MLSFSMFYFFIYIYDTHLYKVSLETYIYASHISEQIVYFVSQEKPK